MLSQIYTIRVDYWSEIHKEVGECVLKIWLSAIVSRIESLHKNSKLTYECKDIDRIEWIYENNMKYRRYKGMSMREFYNENITSVNTYYAKKYWGRVGRDFDNFIENMYDDIVEWD